MLKRLFTNGEIEVDGDRDYLTLYGARRGFGEKQYRERGNTAAQQTFRYADPKITSEMYFHIQTSDNSENVTEVFGDER